MRLAGIIVNLAGFALAISGLLISQSTSVRMVLALAGIGVSLFAIFGLINGYYLKNAIWKK
jgi:hypothetical protein